MLDNFRWLSYNHATMEFGNDSVTIRVGDETARLGKLSTISHENFEIAVYAMLRSLEQTLPLGSRDRDSVNCFRDYLQLPEVV
jgi:hypothetical protein